MENSIIIASSTQKENYKKIAQRLIFHLKQKEERQKIQSKRIFQNCFKAFLLRVEYFWNKIIPITIRGTVTQYQILANHFQGQYNKNQRLIKLSIDEFFNQLNQKYLTVICYDVEEINQFKTIFQSLDSLKNIKIAPLDTKSQVFRNYFKSKFEISQKCVLLICKGLFDEIFILKTIKFGDKNICDKITKTIKMRQDYQQSIRNELQELQRQLISSTSQSTIHQIQINLAVPRQEKVQVKKKQRS